MPTKTRTAHRATHQSTKGTLSPRVGGSGGRTGQEGSVGRTRSAGRGGGSTRRGIGDSSGGRRSVGRIGMGAGRSGIRSTVRGSGVVGLARRGEGAASVGRTVADSRDRPDASSAGVLTSFMAQEGQARLRLVRNPHSGHCQSICLRGAPPDGRSRRTLQAGQTPARARASPQAGQVHLGAAGVTSVQPSRGSG